MSCKRSGRRDGKLLVEDCLTLDLAWLMRLAPIGDGQSGIGEINWRVDGDPVCSLRFRLDLLSKETVRLVLHYSVATSNGNTKPARQLVALATSSQHLGGHRWWMRCPVSGERVRCLYLPPGGDRFASRAALGLSYRVERLTRFDRPFEKLFRLQRRLDHVQGLGTGLKRPKGMWNRTYAGHETRFDGLDVACAEKIAAMIERA